MAGFSTLTITSGTTSTGSIMIPEDHALTSVKVPSDFTGATIAVHGSHDDADWKAVSKDGAAFTIPGTVSLTQQVNPLVTFGLKSIKLVSASSEGGNRVLEISISKVI